MWHSTDTVSYPFLLSLDTPAKIAPSKPTAAGSGASLVVNRTHLRTADLGLGSD